MLSKFGKLMMLGGGGSDKWWERLNTGDWVEKEKGYFVGLIKNDSKKPLDVHALFVSKREFESYFINTLYRDWYVKDGDVDGHDNTNYLLNQNNNDFKSEVIKLLNTISNNTNKSDWYIPSFKELMMLFHKLKPFDANNNINDSSIKTVLEAVPQLSTFNTSIPKQTEVVEFKSGGADQFQAQLYNISGRIGGVFNSASMFDSGIIPLVDGRNYSFRIRPVRRVYCYTETGSSAMATLGRIAAEENIRTPYEVIVNNHFGGINENI